LDLLQPFLAVASGSFVGFTLGLIGGGGSVMATPLLLYVVGLQPHVAIGTGAVAVSATAFANFRRHARAGNVWWRCAIQFSVVGIIGAAVGSLIGKQLDGRRLLFLFAIFMVAIGVLMLRRKAKPNTDTRELRGEASGNPTKLIATSFVVGALSGFFGIGGGFLIMPGLLFATGMPIICAIGSSLLAVGFFSLTTSVSYGLSGLIDWPVAAEYLAGGVAGGLWGTRLATRLASHKATLNRIFASLVFIVAIYMLYRTLNDTDAVLSSTNLRGN
jgi:uncharacterized membrane protein YfcA